MHFINFNFRSRFLSGAAIVATEKKFIPSWYKGRGREKVSGRETHREGGRARNVRERRSTDGGTVAGRCFQRRSLVACVCARRSGRESRQEEARACRPQLRAQPSGCRRGFWVCGGSHIFPVSVARTRSGRA